MMPASRFRDGACRGSKTLFDLLGRLVRDESAQDLTEYALLAAFIGIAGYLVLQALGGEIFNTYSKWLSPNTGVPSKWDPPAPSGS